MSMIDYTIGDNIVAIKDHSMRVFKEGQLFTCNALKKCKCGLVLVDIGIKSRSGRSFCTLCKSNELNNGIWWVKAALFKKLDFDISELTNILEKENVAKLK